jgi:signal transduction protein with GAF and PtsI domain
LDTVIVHLAYLRPFAFWQFEPRHSTVGWLRCFELVSVALEQTPQRLRELGLLERVVRATASASDPRQLLDSIVDEMTVAAGVEVCSLYIWDERRRALVLTATNGLPREGIGKVNLSLGEGVTGWVAAQRQPLAVRDVRYEARFKWVAELDSDRYISMLSVPITLRDNVLGVLNLQTAKEHIFTDPEIAFATAMAAQVAGIIGLISSHEQAHGRLSEEQEMVKRLTSLMGDKREAVAVLADDFIRPLAAIDSLLTAALQGASSQAYEEIHSEVVALQRKVVALMGSLGN